MLSDREVALRKQEAEEAMAFLLRHPLRARLLALHVESKEPLSPKELAASTKEPLAKVVRHVRVLRDHRAIYLAEARTVGGAVEHFYAATMRVDLVPWAREALGVKSLHQAVLEALQARREDKEFMDRLHRCLEEDRAVLEAIRKSEEREETAKAIEKECQ